MKRLLPAVAVFALASAAQAGSVSYSASGYANASSNATGLPLQQDILLSDFDPTIGWLRGVTVSYTFWVSSGGTSGGTRLNPTAFSLLDKSGADLLGGVTSGTALCGSPLNPDSFSCSTAHTTGVVDLPTDVLSLHSFLGTGMYKFTYVGEPNVIAWGGASYGVRYTVGVTYNYLTVAEMPEPATWGMMILGFGAVGAVLRRRKPAFGLA
ncbi:MAG TPA: PEPxxWA-CTERM sorting domain-containing protein [Sphingomonas sp.]|uniref:PEPxxWA-CTERM sorting domain-containing protein n=1 Tax=Sphingomonas sp. TaxID=28214 RepID=UPI002B6E31BF|nr:PEPxxWA-CTERM sorting domain-containing protein [Sphingomonas sp.]HMI18959.1 PEPxxWA-CTERM sorting domain-containing protein [Sphingomonas sp.]